MTPQRWITAAFLVSSAVVLPGMRAHATGGGATIGDLTVRDGMASLTVSVTVPAGESLVPDRTQVTVAGQPVESHVTASAASSAKARIAVLAVDTSGSMGPAGISAARDAAGAYIARVAPDVRVGLISFADRPRVITQPTTDRSALRSGLSQLRSKGETSLYDAVQLAVREAGPGGAVVVLSDGADTVSHSDLAETLGRVQASGARVSTVAFRTQDGVRGPLTQIARAGGGRVVAASGASDLASAFADAAAALPAQLSVTAVLPERIAAGDRLAVTVASGSSTWTATAALPATPAASAPSARASSLPAAATLVSGVPWYASLAAVLAVVFVALLLLGWLLAPRPETDVDKRKRMLDVYTVNGRQRRKVALVEPSTGAAGGLVDLSQRLIDRRGTAASIAIKLERAGSRLRPGEWVVLRVCTVLAVTAVVSVATRNVLIGIVAGIVLGWLSTWMWLRHRQSRREKAFADSLPDTLQLVASSLRTGFSLPQALDAAQQDGVQPMAAELGRALAAARIGAPLEDELDQIAERTSSEDWRWAVMAIRIQRAVGGNLAEVLMTTVRTLRERAATRRQIRTLSAEGRLSAYILVGLPLLVTSVLLTFRRAYLRPLWTTTPGLVMVTAAVLLMGVGALWMRKVVTVEV